MSNNQLTLIETPAPSVFRIDERTRELGKSGIAAARQALLAAKAGSTGSNVSLDDRRAA